jgi:hypothetical protein
MKLIVEHMLAMTDMKYSPTIQVSDAECHALAAAYAVEGLPAGEPKEIVSFGRRLLGMYRKDDFSDPVMFVKALSAVFSAYPAAICEEVLDPLTGIPSQLKFTPALCEVKDALDAAMLRHQMIVSRACAIPEERKKAIDEAMHRAVSIPWVDSRDFWLERAILLLKHADPANEAPGALDWVGEKTRAERAALEERERKLEEENEARRLAAIDEERRQREAREAAVAELKREFGSEPSGGSAQ